MKLKTMNKNLDKFGYPEILQYDNPEFHGHQKGVAIGIKDNGTNKRYNIDAIIHCFRNGIEKYMKQHSILNSYEEIGKTFVCLYDIE